MVSEERNVLRAGERLKKELKAGLEASGFVISKKTGRKVSFEQLAPVLGMEFNPAKRDLFRTVQKREKRLGTGSEVRLIQSARKTGGKGIKWI